MSFMQMGLRQSIWILVFATMCSCSVFDKKQTESPAERILKHQIERSPRDATSHYQLGLLYYSESRYRLASNQLKKAIEIKPDYAEAYLALGSSLTGLGEYRASIDSFQKAINYNVTYWPEAYNLIGAAYRDTYYVGNERSKEPIELSLNNFLKASERCNDVNKSLCLSIIQNIVVSYIDFYAMSGDIDKKDNAYPRKAINYARKALTPANRQNNKYQYAMLQYSLSQAYMNSTEIDNVRKAAAALNEALLILDKNAYPTEHSMVQNSLELLKREQGDEDLATNRINNSPDETLITVQFVTEEGKQLQNAAATLIESKSDEFIRAHFRQKPVGKNGSISLPSHFLNLPRGSSLFVCTSDEFYCHSFDVTDIKKMRARDRKITLTVPKTGIISATIIKYEKGIEQPLVVPVSRLNKNGIYEEFYGIGIGLSNNYPFSVSGLPSGIYTIKVKKNYEDSTIYYQKDGIKVIAGKKTDLGGIELKVK